jgi:hypothetical protein
VAGLNNISNSFGMLLKISAAHPRGISMYIFRQINVVCVLAKAAQLGLV